MLRRLSYGLLLVFLAASCSRETDVRNQEWNGPVISFDFNIEGAPVVKSGDETYDAIGENPYRENQIDFVDFFFYPGGKTSSNATYHVKKIFTTRNNASFRLEVTPYEVDRLIFPKDESIEETTVLAVCNSQIDFGTLMDTSMDNLFAQEVETDFVSPTNHRQANFMMSGTTVIHLAGRSQKEVAQGVIDLKRYACKITVGVEVEDVVAVETNNLDDYGKPIIQYWEPVLEFTKIYLVDGLKTVALGGNAAGEEGGASLYDFFSYEENQLKFFNGPGDPIFDMTGNYYNTYPMYTYPQHWERGNDQGNTREPYLKLIMHWRRRSDTGIGLEATKKEFYYKIAIPQDMRAEDNVSFMDRFVRNNWYHYNIKVGMLGADTDEAAVDINPIDVYVYFWQDKNVVVKQASIGNARYLAVEREEYTIYNQPELDLRYTSSHPIKFTVESVTRPYYGTVSEFDNNGNRNTALGGTIYYIDSEDPTNHPPRLLQDDTDPAKKVYDKDIYPDKSYYLEYSEAQRKALRKSSDKMDGKDEDWFSDSGKAIALYHPLNNSYDDVLFDYSPYIMYISIVHSDEGQGAEYAKKMKVKQYPAVYIESEVNSDVSIDPNDHGDVTVNNAKAWINFQYNGYVYVDGDRRMRHTEGTNEGGLYGTYANELVALGKKYSFVPTFTFDPSKGRGGCSVSTQLEWLQWRTVNFTGGSRVLYNISVSVLPADKDYIIGDPRTMEPDNLHPETQLGYPGGGSKYLGDNPEEVLTEEKWNQLIATPHPFVQPLQHYYPAEKSERTRNMVAPSYRVASKFGGLEYYDGVTFDSAKYKCATYQEDGYPAGRWRLPTLSEINFIAMLSEKGDFVKLFSSSGKYWSAHGAIRPGNTKVLSETYALARCVYDSWYWDQFDDRLPKGDRDHYVLGDLERQ